jgi:hypothetical protein
MQRNGIKRQGAMLPDRQRQVPSCVCVCRSNRSQVDVEYQQAGAKKQQRHQTISAQAQPSAKPGRRSLRSYQMAHILIHRLLGNVLAWRASPRDCRASAGSISRCAAPASGEADENRTQQRAERGRIRKRTSV